MADVIALVRLVADAAGNAALPGWAVSAYGLEQGRWDAQLTKDGRLVLRPIPEAEADAGTPPEPEPAPVG